LTFPEIIFREFYLFGGYFMENKTNKLVRIAVLSALSIVLVMLIRFPIIPSAHFLEYEPGDVPMLVAAFMYGPVAGLVMTVIVSVVQAFTVSAASGWVGMVMHIISTGALVVISGIIYKKFHTFKGAFAALAAGSISMVLVMIPMNLFFTVRFYGVPYDAVVAMLPTAILPFNIIKSLANSLIVILVYKPLSRFLKGESKVSKKTA
jgi:riboflavin transporter FmnP